MNISDIIDETKKLMNIKTYSVLDSDPADAGYINRKLSLSSLDESDGFAKDELNAKNLINNGLGIQYCNNKFQQIVWMSHRIAFLEQQLMKLDKDGYDELYSRNRGEK